MRSVQVLLSSYNGGESIKRQIDSILNQKEVDIHILIRDDGSKDQTRKILKVYQNRYPDKIQIVFGDNVGYKKSFFSLIQMAGTFDYYAFADQDDYWFDDKEISSIRTMESDLYQGPKLAQVDILFSNDKLKPINPQPHKRNVLITSHDQIYADDIFQGCTMTWNYEAMKLFKQYVPKGNYSHDHWVGKICYLLGRVYFVPDEKMDYIRYENNVSITGNRFAARILRLKRLLRTKGSVYDNFGLDLLIGYKKQLSSHDQQICQDFFSYKHNWRAKWRLLSNFKLKRGSLIGTLFYKFSILMNRV